MRYWLLLPNLNQQHQLLSHVLYRITRQAHKLFDFNLVLRLQQQIPHSKHHQRMQAPCTCRLCHYQCLCIISMCELYLQCNHSCCTLQYVFLHLYRYKSVVVSNCLIISLLTGNSVRAISFIIITRNLFSSCIITALTAYVSIRCNPKLFFYCCMTLISHSINSYTLFKINKKFSRNFYIHLTAENYFKCSIRAGGD